MRVNLDATIFQVICDKSDGLIRVAMFDQFTWCNRDEAILMATALLKAAEKSRKLDG